MVYLVGKDGITAADKGRHDANVGHVASAEVERVIHAGESRKARFERFVGGVVAADQMRCAGPDTPALGAAMDGFGQHGFCGQTEVIVGAKGRDRLLAVNQTRIGAARRGNHAAAAAQAGSVEIGKAGADFVERVDGVSQGWPPKLRQSGWRGR